VTAAGAAMVQLLEAVSPDPAVAETYDRLFERYVALYPRIRDLGGA
jgi:sugar (pentulose or hexulose) kinase